MSTELITSDCRLVIRDRSTANNGTMNERRYAMQDGNWNKQASTPTDEGGCSASAVETATRCFICDTTGSVGERYAYSAYGAPVFMTGAGTVQSSSPIGFETLYAGYRWDNPTPQMYYVRNRFLLPQVGTWNRRDPLGYRSQNASLYVYARNNSIYYIDPLGLDEIDDYHRDLFNYYQSLMQVMILVGDELHANGTANLGKKFPWLAGKYNCTGGRGAIAGKDRESILFVQIPYRAKEPFPILWPELANAIRYSQKEYGDFEDWILVEGASLNLHGLWFLVITNGYPWLHLGKEPFLRGPREAIETIIHEPQHDFCNYGAYHDGGMQNIVPCDAEGVPADSKYGSAYEQYIDFLQATKDEQGVSLWEKMEKWVGRKPIKPIRQQVPQLPSFEEYEKRYPLSPIN